MIKISPSKLDENVFSLIGKQWMLITTKENNDADSSDSGDEKVNAMTASWGGFGFLWNKPVAFIFVRPQRYTFELLEKTQNVSLSFLSEQYRDALNFFGKNSGRDCDKFAKTGLTVKSFESGHVGVEQSEIIVLGSKLFAQDIKEENFIDQNLVNTFYPKKDFHRMYTVGIDAVYTNKT